MIKGTIKKLFLPGLVLLCFIYFFTKGPSEKPNPNPLILKIGHFNIYQNTLESKMRDKEDLKNKINILDHFISYGLLYKEGIDLGFDKSLEVQELFEKQNKELKLNNIKENKLRFLLLDQDPFEYKYIVNYYFIPERVKYNKSEIIDKLKNKDWVRDRLDDNTLFFKRKEISKITIPEKLVEIIMGLDLNGYRTFESNTGLHIVQLFRIEEKGIMDLNLDFNDLESFGWDDELLNDVILESKVEINKPILKKIDFSVRPLEAMADSNIVCTLPGEFYTEQDLADRIRKLPFEKQKLFYNKNTRLKATASLLLLSENNNLKKDYCFPNNSKLQNLLLKKYLLKEFLDSIQGNQERNFILMNSFEQFKDKLNNPAFFVEKRNAISSQEDYVASLVKFHTEISDPDNVTDKDEIKFFPLLNPEIFEDCPNLRVNHTLLNKIDFKFLKEGEIIASTQNYALTIKSFLGDYSGLSSKTQQELLKKENLISFIEILFNKRIGLSSDITYHNIPLEKLEIFLLNKFFNDVSASVVATMENRTYSVPWLKEKLYSNSSLKREKFTNFNYLRNCTKKVIIEDYLNELINRDTTGNGNLLEIKQEQLKYKIIVEKIYESIGEDFENITFNNESRNLLWKNILSNYYQHKLNYILQKRLNNDQIEVDFSALKNMEFDVSQSVFKDYLIELSNSRTR